MCELEGFSYGTLDQSQGASSYAFGDATARRRRRWGTSAFLAFGDATLPESFCTAGKTPNRDNCRTSERLAAAEGSEGYASTWGNPYEGSCPPGMLLAGLRASTGCGTRTLDFNCRLAGKLRGSGCLTRFQM